VPEAFLNDCQEYRVGRFTLQPFRQLLDGGTPVLIGRKPLELLSVLAKAEGALVTKDELMAAVWPNAIVEDNALQVHVGALRKLLGTDAELLSTVHGFGYRLATIPAVAAPKPEAPLQVPSPTTAPRRHDFRIALTLLPVLCVGVAVLWLFRDRLPWTDRPHEARVAVLSFDTQGQEGASHAFADALQDEILSELSDNHIQAVSRLESRGLRGPAAGPVIEKLGVDLLLDGTVQTDGKTINVRLYLDDARERVSIWSDEIQGSADAPKALEAQVATRASDIAFWAKTGRSGKVRLDAATLAAFIAGRESTTSIRDASGGAALADYRKVIAAAPNFSWGHSAVAVTDAFALLSQPSVATDPKEQLRVEVQLEARRALALEPHNGEAYLALELAMPPLDWKGREALLVEGAAMDPNFEAGAMMEGRLLWNVGRGRDALAWFQRAHDLDLLHNGASWSLALSLAEEGHKAESRDLVAQMQVQWPGQMSTRDARFWTSIVDGATDDAFARLADPAARPLFIDQTSADAWSTALKAMSSADPLAKAAAVKQIKQASDTGSLSRGHALTLLAMLGDIDGAFAQAELYRPISSYSPPFLFLSSTVAMRSDHRFMPLARKLGYVTYWRATGHWPDFCSEPALPYDCRVEAEKSLKFVRN
jgi:DNA-binding winged helix-turn-helix (wHTH) protein/TolB-like protein/tetratricopeptide (TPR) repeat protein